MNPTIPSLTDSHTMISSNDPQLEQLSRSIAQSRDNLTLSHEDSITILIVGLSFAGFAVLHELYRQTRHTSLASRLKIIIIEPKSGGFEYIPQSWEVLAQNDIFTLPPMDHIFETSEDLLEKHIEEYKEQIYHNLSGYFIPFNSLDYFMPNTTVLHAYATEHIENGANLNELQCYSPTNTQHLQNINKLASINSPFTHNNADRSFTLKYHFLCNTSGSMSTPPIKSQFSIYAQHLLNDITMALSQHQNDKNDHNRNKLISTPQSSSESLLQQDTPEISIKRLYNAVESYFRALIGLFDLSPHDTPSNDTGCRINLEGAHHILSYFTSTSQQHALYFLLQTLVHLPSHYVIFLVAQFFPLLFTQCDSSLGYINDLLECKIVTFICITLRMNPQQLVASGCISLKNEIMKYCKNPQNLTDDSALILNNSLIFRFTEIFSLRSMLLHPFTPISNTHHYLSYLAPHPKLREFFPFRTINIHGAGSTGTEIFGYIADTYANYFEHHPNTKPKKPIIINLYSPTRILPLCAKSVRDSAVHHFTTETRYTKWGIKLNVLENTIATPNNAPFGESNIFNTIDIRAYGIQRIALGDQMGNQQDVATALSSQDIPKLSKKKQFGTITSHFMSPESHQKLIAYLDKQEANNSTILSTLPSILFAAGDAMLNTTLPPNARLAHESGAKVAYNIMKILQQQSMNSKRLFQSLKTIEINSSTTPKTHDQHISCITFGQFRGAIASENMNLTPPWLNLVGPIKSEVKRMAMNTILYGDQSWSKTYWHIAASILNLTEAISNLFFNWWLSSKSPINPTNDTKDL